MKEEEMSGISSTREEMINEHKFFEWRNWHIQTFRKT
jgi:hypothetical protein